MKEKLLNEKDLEWSSVVANNAMNRERVAFGINSYQRDLKINPIEFIQQRTHQESICWFDLCCGQGNAIIQTAQFFQENPTSQPLQFIGIDLVNYFSSYENLDFVKLIPMNLSQWTPHQKADLITIAHGLHYIGDKLGLIEKSAAALKMNGIFIANLDLNNFVIEGIENTTSVLLKHFKKYEIHYDAKTKILRANKNTTMKSIFEYLGADDQAGPNYTGQRAVNSHYKLL